MAELLTCDVCGQTFTSGGALRLHVFLDHQPGDQPAEGPRAPAHAAPPAPRRKGRRALVAIGAVGAVAIGLAASAALVLNQDDSTPAATASTTTHPEKSPAATVLPATECRPDQAQLDALAKDWHGFELAVAAARDRAKDQDAVDYLRQLNNAYGQESGERAAAELALRSCEPASWTFTVPPAPS